jgi:hypothetical protein
MFNDLKKEIQNELLMMKNNVYISFEQLISRINYKYLKKVNISEKEMQTFVYYIFNQG